MHEESEKAVGVDGQGDANAREVDSEGKAVSFRTVPLNSTHNKELFTCARSQRVQDYLRKECRKIIAQDLTRLFVWPFEDEPTRIAGYFTLSCFVVQKKEFQKPQQNKMPKGLPAPVALIGMMGKDDAVTEKLGPHLIREAALRANAAREHLAIWGLALNPETPGLAKWYTSQGFVAGLEDSGIMFGSLATFLPELRTG